MGDRRLGTGAPFWDKHDRIIVSQNGGEGVYISLIMASGKHGPSFTESNNIFRFKHLFCSNMTICIEGNLCFSEAVEVNQGLKMCVLTNNLLESRCDRLDPMWRTNCNTISCLAHVKHCFWSNFSRSSFRNCLFKFLNKNNTNCIHLLPYYYNKTRLWTEF